MKTITLKYGFTVLVDNDDYALVMQYCWHVDHPQPNYNKARYAVHSIDNAHKLMMHNLLIPNCRIDHKDRNGLNNQRSNLRILTTNDSNQINVGLRRDNTSGYKGVSRCGNKWQAYIGQQDKKYYLGVYTTKVAAAKAYNAKALELFGEFAYLNEIDVEVEDSWYSKPPTFESE